MNADTLVSQAVVEFSNQNQASAKQLLERALTMDPHHLHAISNLGNLHLLDKQFSTAEDFFKQALKKSPRFAPAAIGLTKSYIAQRRFAEALPVLQTVREGLAKDEQGEFFQLLGVVFAGKEDWEAAIAFFKKYAKHCPDQCDPLLCLYKAYTGNGDLPSAMDQLGLILQRIPSQVPIWIQLATLCSDANAPERLRKVCHDMTQAHAENLTLYNLAARLLCTCGQYAYAACYCWIAIQKFPDYDRSQFIDLARMENLL